MSLELPPLVRSGVFYFYFYFYVSQGACFCCFFRPSSKVGNSRLHSTQFDYLSFCGMGKKSARVSGFRWYAIAAVFINVGSLRV